MSSDISLFTKGLGVACVALSLSAFGATHYVSPDGNHTAPFLTWETAATNIQSAIASTTAGDLVLVTNGIYATGGAPVSPWAYDTQTNRVALTNAIIVRSVNGPKVTIIEGAKTSGTTVRCAYLAAGATLDGFTLTNGVSGAYCYDGSATITNCIITGNAGVGVNGGTVRSSLIEKNTSTSWGGGAYGSALISCIVRSNTAVSGGGAYYGSAAGCAFVGNVATSQGGGIYAVNAINCTIVQNTANYNAGGAYSGRLTNCIVYYNSAPSSVNYVSSTIFSSCISPLPYYDVSGNISAVPRLMPDFIHLRPDSPCLGKGSASSLSGADIDGTPWNSPPPMGCDDWSPVLVAASTSIQPIPAVMPGDVLMSFAFVGETPSCQWFKEGVLLSDGQKYSAASSSQLLVRSFGPSDAGAYQLVATNNYGAITTAVMQLNVRCVDLQSAAPAVPCASWETAGTNLQEVIDSAQGTTVVLVTNGVFATGQSSLTGFGANRIVLNGPVSVIGVNGPEHTIIQGEWDSAITNGPASVRCVLIGPDAFLGGFTLSNGSTTGNGGGINALLPAGQTQVYGCVVTNCSAKLEGGGAYGLGLADCLLSNNRATKGGAVSFGSAVRSSLVANSAAYGAGAYDSLVESCQVVGNFGAGVYRGDARRSLIATNTGAGVAYAKAENCRIIGNLGSGVEYSLVLGSLIKGNSPFGSAVSTNLNCTIVANAYDEEGSKSTNCLFAFNKALTGDWSKAFSIVQPLGFPIGINQWVPLASNYDLFPNLLSDLEHIAVNSPCIARGTNHALVQFDIDGQPFRNPPAIGCDEWYPEIIIAAQPRVTPGDLPGEAFFFFDLAGTPEQCWWVKDGSPIQAGDRYAAVTSNSLRIRNFGPLDIGDYQVVASNSFGTVTSAVVHVKVSCVDPNTANPAAPFNSWQTAARTIQEAVDIADLETVVVVTNGVYATGTRAVGSDTPNRLVVDKPIALISANGADNTIIEGAWDPVSTNGTGSVRCAWLSPQAMMGGFTFRNGSTQKSGGGIWVGLLGNTVNLSYCVVTNCSSKESGGGVYGGRVQKCAIVGNYALRANGGGTAFSMAEHSMIKYNRASSAGGMYGGVARGCQVHQNTASGFSGGVDRTHLMSCSIAFNAAWSGNVSGAAIRESQTQTIYQCTSIYHSTIVSNTAWNSITAGANGVILYNSIVYHNSGLDDLISGRTFENLSSSSKPNYVCSPFPTNSTNGYVLNTLPQLIDSAHLASTSPCIAAGTPLGNLGFDDIDGEPWAAKPSMGCDEFCPSGLVGPLGITVVGWPQVAAGGSMPLAALIDGKATGVQWDFGDGIITNQVGYNPSHAWSAPGNYTVTATVYNTDHAQGVSASLPIEVIPFTIPALGQPEISGNNFQMSFSSQPGLTYEVYTATNLAAPIDWKLLKRLYSTGESMSITDTNAPAKFYRLEVKP